MLGEGQIDVSRVVHVDIGGGELVHDEAGVVGVYGVVGGNFGGGGIICKYRGCLY